MAFKRVAVIWLTPASTLATWLLLARPMVSQLSVECKCWPNSRKLQYHAQFFPESACEGFFVKKQPLYYIFTPSHLHLHTFTPADLNLHTLTSADLHHLTSAGLHLHTLTSADLHLHTLTFADLHLHTLTSADLHLHTFTSADLHLHTLTSADLHLHTFTSADIHLHTPTSADLHLHTFTSADLLSLFFLFSLKAGAVPPERHETQPFRTKWTLDVKN